MEDMIYFGNLMPEEPQFKAGGWRGLALEPRFERDVRHDAREPMPFQDESVPGFQSQDVFEHIERDQIRAIFDEIYRCLRPGGLFRLSMPDYNAPLLRRRSVFDTEGRILCDLMMGGSVAYAQGGVAVTLSQGGGSHVWFPTYSQVLALVIASSLRLCRSIVVQQAWIDLHDYVCHDFDHSVMPVARCWPKDIRSEGKPVSIVVDFIK